MSINVFSIMVHYCQKNDRRTLFETIKDEKDPRTSSWWLRFINNSYIEFINNSTGSSGNYYTYCHVTYVTFVCSDKQTLSSMNDSTVYTSAIDPHGFTWSALPASLEFENTLPLPPWLSSIGALPGKFIVSTRNETLSSSN